MFRRKLRASSTWMKMIANEANAGVVTDETSSKASRNVQEYSGEIYTDYGNHECQSLGSAVANTASNRLARSDAKAESESTSAITSDMSFHH